MTSEDLEEQILARARALRGPAKAAPLHVRVVEHTNGRSGPAGVGTVTAEDGDFWCCGALGTREDALLGMLRTLEGRLASQHSPPSARTSDSGTVVSAW